MKINQQLVDALVAASDQLTARGLSDISDVQVLLALAASTDEINHYIDDEAEAAGHNGN